MCKCNLCLPPSDSEFRAYVNDLASVPLRPVDPSSFSGTSTHTLKIEVHATPAEISFSTQSVVVICLMSRPHPSLPVPATPILVVEIGQQ